MGMIVLCLNHIWQEILGNDGYFFYNPIAVDNIEQAIANMTRIKIGNLYYDKTYFTEEGKVLEGIEGKAALKDEIVLSLQAKRNQTVSRKSMIDYLRKMAAEDSKITRIRLEGKNDSGNTIIDTYLTKKINNVNVQLDKKGLVDDHSIFARMEEVFGINE
jgi:ABC-type phosphate transport system auxiliary subunit